MPAHACSLVWRGTLLVFFLGCPDATFRHARLECDPRPVATTFVENMSCDHMFYFAPSRQPPAAIA